MEDGSIQYRGNTTPPQGNTVYLLIPYGTDVAFELFVKDANKDTLVFRSCKVPIQPRAGYIPPEGTVTLDKTALSTMDQVQATVSIKGGTAPYKLKFGYPVARVWEEGFQPYTLPVTRLTDFSFTAQAALSGKYTRLDFEYLDADDRLIAFSSPDISLTGTPAAASRDIQITVDPAKPSPLRAFEFRITALDGLPLGATISS